MNSKLVCFVFAICIYGVSCVSYEDAVTKCKAEYKVTTDDPIDYFLAKGEFQPGYENLKCFFSCITQATEIADGKGAPVADKLAAMAKTSNSPDLQLFSDENIMKACIPPKDLSTPCDATFSFVKCALEQKAMAEKSKSM